MEETSIDCPYCGESIAVLLDCSIEQQEYVEDCQVCCSPIVFSVSASVDGELLEVQVRQENS